jgi:hypothetical protein
VNLVLWIKRPFLSLNKREHCRVISKTGKLGLYIHIFDKLLLNLY